MFLDVSDVDTRYDLLVQSICQVSHSFYFQPCGDVKGIGLILHRGNCALKKKKTSASAFIRQSIFDPGAATSFFSLELKKSHQCVLKCSQSVRFWQQSTNHQKEYHYSQHYLSL